MSKIAVVTGANKGIGFCIAEQLCEKLGPDSIVYLTARDVGRGEKAVQDLAEKGLKPKFHQLDIASVDSIRTFASFLKETHGGLDILVNNAGIAFMNDKGIPFSEQAEKTIEVNYTGLVNVCKELFPLLRPHSRVVNVSSMLIRMTLKKFSPEMHERVKSEMTMDELGAFMQEFVELAKAGTHQEKGFSNSAYSVSKIGVTKLSYIQQKLFDTDEREDIIVNACCPGFCKTDLNGHRGAKSPQDGADTPVYLALLPPGTVEPKGEHVEDRKIIKTLE
ncbi:carbonyl reductase [NADPH] 1-like [Tubulanus polymorphus]|uniref:carbonyl reductase [NADPH] 1-like n=1 Tax=Tubulanus polymorphus TaxID=672921 RepID=UPI003DA20117